MNSTTSPTELLFNGINVANTTDSVTIELPAAIQTETPKWLKYQTNLSSTGYSQGFGDLQHDKSLNSITGIKSRTLKCRQNKIKNQFRKDVTSYSPYERKRSIPLSTCINDTAEEIMTKFSCSLSKNSLSPPENSSKTIENDL